MKLNEQKEANFNFPRLLTQDFLFVSTLFKHQHQLVGRKQKQKTVQQT